MTLPDVSERVGSRVVPGSRWNPPGCRQAWWVIKHQDLRGIPNSGYSAQGVSCAAVDLQRAHDLLAKGLGRKSGGGLGWRSLVAGSPKFQQLRRHPMVIVSEKHHAIRPRDTLCITLIIVIYRLPSAYVEVGGRTPPHVRVLPPGYNPPTVQLG